MGRAWLIALSLAACGPVAYVNQVTRNAATSVDQARAVNAAKYSPYWWTRAVEYLHKARENASRADFQGANRWGKLSTEAAQKALLESDMALAAGHKSTDDHAPGSDHSDEPTKLAPAKDTP